MISKIYSAIPTGFDGKIIEVEGDSNRGLPGFNIVGMGDKSITESRERVRSSIVNSDFSFPDDKVTVNLAPADLHKNGTFLDLPIALSVLTLSGQLLPGDTKGKLFVGELSLDGSLRAVPGIINIVETAQAAGFAEVYLPEDNLVQAQLIEGVKLVGVKNLQQLFLHLKDQKLIEPPAATAREAAGAKRKNTVFLDYVRGQEQAKRALEIAVAGHHNILLSGPPGSGKTMLARVAAGLLPRLTTEERIAITKLHSLTTPGDGVVTERPFRAPHHTSSRPALIGCAGRPGEISLAHHGVLFLDELPEYPRSSLEALRQPLEDRAITISRADQKMTFPADFMLVATMNPCPCGYLGDPTHECTCTVAKIEAYQKKLSGPLLDRIDLCVEVQKVDNEELLRQAGGTGAIEHAKAEFRIKKALARQHRRYKSETKFNAALSSHQVATELVLTKEAEKILGEASERLALSARAYFKVIKVAQTIADLDGSDQIDAPQVAEALQYRFKEKLI